MQLHEYCATHDLARLPFRMPYTIQYWCWQYRVKAKEQTPIRRGVDGVTDLLEAKNINLALIGLTRHHRVRVN